MLPAIRSQPTGQAVSLMDRHTCCSVVLLTLVIGPFLADFDLSDSPSVYKTAALLIELRRRPLKGSGTLLRGGWQVDSLHWVGRRARRVDQHGRRNSPQHEDRRAPLGGHGVAVHESFGT